MLFFPLSLDMSDHVFHVGDTMSGTTTFANKSGRDVNVVSNIGNGAMSCVHVCNIKDLTGGYTHTLLGYEVFMKTGDKEVNDFKYEFTEPGIYIVFVHSSVSVNNYPIWNNLCGIVIVLEFISYVYLTRLLF
jgi:hypothetical protein